MLRRPNRYVEQLHADMEDAGLQELVVRATEYHVNPRRDLINAAPFDQADEPIGRIHPTYFDHLMEETKVVFRTHEPGHIDTPPFARRTTVGKILEEVQTSQYEFESTDNGFCADAERRLVDTLEHAENPAYQSPLILTSRGVAVAVIKTRGDKTAYGLRSLPERGIIAATLGTPHLAVDLERLPRIDCALEIDIDDVDATVGGARVSTQAIPKWVRRKETPFSDRDHDIRYDHDDIVRAVDRLLGRAQPLPPKLIK